MLIKIASRLIDPIKPSIHARRHGQGGQAQSRRHRRRQLRRRASRDFDTPEHIKQAARDALAKPGVGKYTEVGGIAALRKAIAEELSRVHNTKLTADQILVSCGAKHSLYNLFMALLDPGDEVLIPAPYWVSYPDMVMLAGGKPVILETRAEDDFAVTAEQVRAACDGRVRADRRPQQPVEPTPSAPATRARRSKRSPRSSSRRTCS